MLKILWDGVTPPPTNGGQSENITSRHTMYAGGNNRSDQEWSNSDDHNDHMRTAFSIEEDHGTTDPPPRTLNMFYKGKYIEMLEETYDKFKLQLQQKSLAMYNCLKLSMAQMNKFIIYTHIITTD